MQSFTEHTICDKRKIVAIINDARCVGYTIAQQECIPGEITIAAPILNAVGESVAGLKISVSAKDWTVDRMKTDLAPVLIRTATELARIPGAIF